MKTFIAALLLIASPFCWTSEGWITKDEKSFSIHFKKADEANLNAYQKLINNGMVQVESFFGSKFKNKFKIVIHPNRQSLDSTWQSDWKMPDFKSECWS